MKRFVLYALTLLTAIAALALAVDCANVWLICSSTGNSAYKMKRLYENPEPDEIAIVGSSRACGNFVPSLISPKCFNYGENGMTMGEVMDILQVLQKRKTQAPVILNLDPWGNFWNGRVADYRLAPQSGRLSLFERMPGLRFFGSLRKNAVGAVDAHRSVSRIIDHGAQILKNSRTAGEWAVINAKIRDLAFGGNEQDEERLLDVLKSFDPRQVLVVIAPCSGVWMEHFTGEKQLAALLDRIRRLANVSVIDYYGSTQFADADFTDPTHFNVTGARKFSLLLKEKLMAERE